MLPAGFLPYPLCDIYQSIVVRAWHPADGPRVHDPLAGSVSLDAVRLCEPVPSAFLAPAAVAITTAAQQQNHQNDNQNRRHE